MRKLMLAVAAVAAVLGGCAATDALPSGYVEAEYFDSAKGSILLDFVPNRTDRIEVDFALNELPSATVGVFCSRTSTGDADKSTRMMVCVPSNPHVLSSTYGSGDAKRGVTELTVHNRVKFVYDGTAQQVYLNGETEAMFNTQATFTPKAKLRLFATGTESASANEADLRLYSFKVFAEDGTCRLHLVPCASLPAGETTKVEVGLYDLIAEKFYAGGSKSSVGKLLFVPDEYEELDYIESTGQEHTYLPFQPDMKDSVRAKVSFTAVEETAAAGVFCSRVDANTKGSRYMCTLTSKTLRMVYADNETFIWDHTWENGEAHELEMNGSARTFSVDGTVLNTFSKGASGAAGSYLYLFALRTNNKAASWAKMRLYSYELTSKDGECREKLVPVKKKDGGEVGLYGLKQRTFYGNMGGKGAFLAGSTVCNRWLDEPSIERMSWTTEERPPKVILGRPWKGVVSCDKTDADLLAMVLGEHEIVFTVPSGEGYAALEKRIKVTVTEPVIPAVDPGEVLVEMNKMDGVVTGVSLRFPAANVDRECQLVRGRRDKGVNLGDWTNRQVVASIPAGATEAEVEFAEPMSEGGFRVALVVPMTAKSYVSEGLVAQYDGIENGGIGRHLPRFSAWRNLRSRIGTSDIQTLYSDDFEDDAFSLGLASHKTEAEDILSPAQSGSVMTMEANAIPANYSSLTTIGVFLAVPARGGFGWVGKDRSGAIAVRRFLSGKWTYNTYTLGTITTLDKLVADGNPYRTYTARIDPAKSAVDLDGEAMKATSWTYTSDNTVTSRGIVLGSTTAGAKIRSIRIYDRELTQEEEARNRAVDAIRFEGAAPLPSNCAVSSYQPVKRYGLIIVVE